MSSRDQGEFELDNVASSARHHEDEVVAIPPPGYDPYDPADAREAAHAQNRTKMITSFGIAIGCIVLAMVLALVIKGVLLILAGLLLWSVAVIATVIALRCASKRST
jgi:hypothetical protein